MSELFTTDPTKKRSPFSLGEELQGDQAPPLVDDTLSGELVDPGDIPDDVIRVTQPPESDF